MADKKAQHLVPRVYLKEFSNTSIKKDKHGNQIESINIYINNKNEIEESKMKGLDNNIFTESNFYNLEKDNSNPIIENNFSKIESQYKKVILNLKNRRFDFDDILFISNFTLLQHQRVIKTIKKFQVDFDKITNMLAKLSANEEYINYFEDMSKKILLDYRIENMNKSNLVLEQGIHFIENNTSIPFITSDTPVVHKMLYIDQLKNILNNSNISFSNYLPNEQLFFFFFPLTPKLALISTKFILKKDKKILFIKIDNIKTVSSLNYLSYNNSFQNVYSNKNDTYAYFFRLKENENILYNNIGLYALIETIKNRYIVKLNDYKQDLWSLELNIRENENIEEILEDKIIKSIIFYQNKIEKGGMRKLIVETYNPSQKTLILKFKNTLTI